MLGDLRHHDERGEHHETGHCVATGIDHGAIGISIHAMQSMAIRGFIAHNRESGAYTLTDSGRATLTAILEDAEIGITA
jgi:hypothetical protein